MANQAAYPYFPYGGVEKYAYNLSKHLVELGVEVEIVTSLVRHGKRNAIYDGIKYTFLPPFVGFKLPYSSLTLTRLMFFNYNLCRYLNNQQFDILHTYQASPYFYLHYNKRKPVVFQPFEEIYDYKILKENSKGLYWKLKRDIIVNVKKHIDTFNMKNAEIILSENHSQTEIYEQLFNIDGGKINSLPVGVEIEKVDSILKSNNMSRQDLGLAPNDLVLISVNRFEANKGIKYLIDAFSLLKNKISNSKLILIGTGSEEEKIKTQITDYGLQNDIIHMKNVPEDKLYKCYALSDIYVSPTLDVSSIMSVIEGMACGLPVVSTGQDFWVKNGINGYVVPKMDSMAICQAIVNIYQNDYCHEFGKNSRHIAQDYSFEAIAQKALDIYKHLAHTTSNQVVKKMPSRLE